jgi:hypothetical protein
MEGIGDLTLRDIGRALARYRPFLVLALAMVLIAVFLPGQQTADRIETAPGGFTFDGTRAADLGADGEFAIEGVEGRAPARAPGTTGTRDAPEAVAGGAPPPPAAAAGLGDPLEAPDCDAGLGRLAIPSVYSPNCVAMWPHGADNGGATWRGVGPDEIKIVIYQVPPSASNQAIQAATASDNTDEEQDWNRQKVIDAFESHFETYGRKIVWERIQGSGSETDEQAAKADAIRAADMGAFAVLGGPTGTNAFVEELVARQVICICTVSQPIENYLAWAPYVWSYPLMASTQAYVHRAEYVGKRLAGRPAIHAGDAAYRVQERTFGLVYYETPDEAYKAGADFFERELRERYGVELSDRIAVKGAHIDQAGAAQEAGAVAARLKANEITSVLFAGDPLYPALLTQEATRNNYFPEWVITGSAFTDLAFFARTYDPAQWRNAFGISFLPATIDPDLPGDAEMFVRWHFGAETADVEPHTTESTYPGAAVMHWFFTGLQLAGPNLNPETFRDGMFSFQPVRDRYITFPATSWGRGAWEWDDYLAWDDTTEIWWDPQAIGPDHMGNEAPGMYRYVDMGKRYMPGGWPTSDPDAFETENTTVIYWERPESDQPPEYPRRDP